MSDKVKAMSPSEDKKPGKAVREAAGSAAEKTKASVGAAKEKIQEFSETAKKEASRASEYARERYDSAAESLREGYGKARKDMEKLSQDVATYVKDNPGRSVLMAGALGFLLGLLVRRDRTR